MSNRVVDVGRARGCIPPYPCGVGAGANGTDLPCDCVALAYAGVCGCNDEDRGSVLRCPIHSNLPPALTEEKPNDR